MPIVVRTEQGIRANRGYNQGRNRHLAPPRAHRHPIPISDAQFLRHLLMHLYPWIRCLLFQERCAPRLIARQVMVDDAPGGKYERIFIIRLLCWWNIRDGMHARLTIGETETFLIKTGRARMILGGAGPED